MSDFKVGDVVRLKSGGPWMTVVNPQYKQEDGIFVTWFANMNDQQPSSSAFLAQSLEKMKD